MVGGFEGGDAHGFIVYAVHAEVVAADAGVGGEGKADGGEAGHGGPDEVVHALEGGDPAGEGEDLEDAGPGGDHAVIPEELGDGDEEGSQDGACGPEADLEAGGGGFHG